MSADYPAAITDRLKTAVNNLTFSLSSAYTAADEVVYVTSTTGAPDAGSFHMGTNVLYYTGRTSNSFTGVSGGQDGTVDQDQLTVDGGNEVVFGPEAHHVNDLNEEMVAVQTELGINGANYVKKSLVTAKGDIIAATASGAVDNIAVGTDGQTLIADAASTAGVKWQDEIHIDTTASSETPTPTIAGRRNLFTVTALGADAELQNPTGTKANGDTLLIRIKDDGAARALTYDSEYRAIGVELPATTVISKTVYLGLIYNSADSKWDCLAVGEEA